MEKHPKHKAPMLIAAVWMLGSLTTITLAAEAKKPLLPGVYTGGPEESPVQDPRNLRGIWVNKAIVPTASMQIGGNDLPYTAEGQQRVAHRQELAKRLALPLASPHLTCRPTGVDGMLYPKLGVAVMQTTQQIAFISEEDRNVWRVFLNQRHPVKLEPSYMGHSVGHWEGNTLVVDTLGYNGFGLLDERGTPHSDQLHLIQRITKSADGTQLDFDVTIVDPKYFSKPVTIKRRWGWGSGVRQLEYNCEETPGTVELAYENELFRPVCVMQRGEGEAPSRVQCNAPAPRATDN